jgi:hypothetical protein
MSTEPLRPTTRQLDVLWMYVHHGSHAAAASGLGISVHTVQAHLTTLRSRLGVHNEAQAVYVMWLGFRDHVAACLLSDHGRCLPWALLLRGADEVV